MTPVSTRRAALLALALTATACDLAQFVIDPKPRFEETWNLPGPDTRMSVADLLPAGKVTIKSDSSAFIMTMDSTSFSAVLGPNCAACGPLNGTNALKPAFTMAPGNSSALPTDIVSAAILSGQIVIKMTNNLTFDPLYVSTGGGSPPQGTLVIVVRTAGGIVLGRDSVRGAAVVSGTSNAPFPAGTTMTRTINLNTGTVSGSITVDVSMNSPLGDHLVPIDVTKSFNASATVPTMEVGSVTMNIPSRTFDSGGKDSVAMATKGDAVVGLGMDITFTNPFNTLSGGLNMIFAWGPAANQKITKAVTFPSGCVAPPCVGTSAVTLDSAETQSLLTGGEKVSIKITGAVSSVSAITVTPKQEVKISNRLRLKIRTPSGKKEN